MEKTTLVKLSSPTSSSPDSQAVKPGHEETIYARRFSTEETRVRQETWKILVERFFQRFVPFASTVLDLGAGDGNFIRNIKARRRIAVDLSPHVRALESDGIEVIVAPALELSSKLDCQVDFIFMSNFLEHLPDKHTLLAVLAECHKALAEDGRLMILQPNIRYTKAAYWDYIDHHIALTEWSLQEALDISGFSVQLMIPRFLPYTAKSRAGKLAAGRFGLTLIKWYVKLPCLWRIFGQQTFVIAQKQGARLPEAS